ncbi:MAG: hypothetical protein EOO20_14815, partial [Chryseobacterium sp.]
MKFYHLFFVLLLNLTALNSFCQQTIVPGKKVAKQKWIRDQDYKMKWIMLRDTARVEVGAVHTKVKVSKKTILVITAVNLKGTTSSWIDSTIVNKTDFSPIYHSSSNGQRDMMLRFGANITGYYLDKTSGQRTQIAQQVDKGYFDSNFYPMLLAWLPIDTSLKADINIFDYNPNGKTGLLKARVIKVSPGIFPGKKLGERSVWIIEATDDIAGATSHYYFDKLTRKLFKQEITAGNRRMEMN